jgi:hypothetical protein
MYQSVAVAFCAGQGSVRGPANRTLPSKPR